VFNRGHDFFDVVFLRLFDVISLSEYLRRIRRCPVLASSVGFEQRYVEDVVDLPFPW